MDLTARIEPFKTAVTRLPGQIQEPGDDHPLIGYFCPLVPLEMIHAAGFTPVRLFRFDLAVRQAEAHLPAYCCHLVRGGLEAGMSGRLEGLTGVVFGQTCDSMQNAAFIWPVAVDLPHHYPLALPTRADSSAAREHLVISLARFRDELGRWAGRPLTHEALTRSIDLYDELRRSMIRLYELNRLSPGLLSAEDFLYLVLAAFRLRPETWLDLARPILADMAGTAPEETGLKRLFLAGNLGDDPSFYRLLDQSGAAVVDDDLCTGRRMFDYQTPGHNDPLTALAQAFLDRPLCPCKMTGKNPVPIFLDKVGRSQAQGVVFLLQKYCEPHFFEYPELAKALKEAGLPHLLLETSRPGLNLEQVRVRLEAFLEMIETD